MFVQSYDYDASFETEGDKLLRQHLHRNKAIIMLHDSNMIENIKKLQNTFDDLKKFEIFVTRPDTMILEASLIAEYGLVVQVGPMQDDGERCVKVYFEGSYLSNFEDFEMTYVSKDRKKKLQTSSSEQGFQLTKVMCYIAKLEEMVGHDALIGALWSLAKDMKKARDAGYVKKLSCMIKEVLPELKNAWEEMSLGTLESFIHDRLIKCKVGHELITAICDTLAIDLEKIKVYECNPKCDFYGAGKSIYQMLQREVVRTGTEPEMIFARYLPPLQTCVGKKKDGVTDADNFCGRMVSAQYAGKDLFLTPELGGKIEALRERLIQELGEDAVEDGDKMEVEGGSKCGSKRGSDDEAGEENKENKRRVDEDGNLCVGNRVLSCKPTAVELFFDAMDQPKAEKPTARTLSMDAEAETGRTVSMDAPESSGRTLSESAPESSGRTLSVSARTLSVSAPESSGRTLSLAVDAESLSSPVACSGSRKCFPMTTRSSSRAMSKAVEADEDEDDGRNSSCADEDDGRIISRNDPHPKRNEPPTPPETQPFDYYDY